MSMACDMNGNIPHDWRLHSREVTTTDEGMCVLEVWYCTICRTLKYEYVEPQTQGSLRDRKVLTVHP